MSSDSRLRSASLWMAAGTLVSRGTGFLRSTVMVAALGVGLTADAYNGANVLPNVIYDLLIGGILISTLVPLLVEAGKRTTDKGERFAQTLLTAAVTVLAPLTILVTVAAPLVVGLFGDWRTPGQNDLAVTFGYFFLPQIFFYGMSAVISAILNTRNRFAAPMWTPVLNNLVVISAGLAFIWFTSGQAKPIAPEDMTPQMIAWLGLATTGGIVLQTITLLPSLRASGFRYRPNFDFRSLGLRRMARLAGWMLVYVVANQAAYLVIVRLATGANDAGSTGAGYTAYFTAFTVFQLPHALISVSISAALLPRLSAHAAEGRLEMVAADTARGVRLTGSMFMPITAMFMAFGWLLMVPLFAWGASDVSSAQFMGVVLAAFSVGLLPYSSGHFQLRSFYALQDTRTPAMSNLWGRVVNITVAITVASVATNSSVTVIGLALSTALGYWVTFIVVWARLAKRLNGVDTKGTIGTLLRSTVASVIALIPGLAVALPIWWNFGDIQLQIMAGVAGGLGCAVTGVVYLLLAPKFRLDEVHGLATSMLGRVIKR